MADFIVTGPLDPTLIRAFDRALDATFELGNSTESYLFADYSEMRAITIKLGDRLLGSRKLAEMVIDSLADGPGEGDVLVALSDLYDQGIVDFDAAVYAQILRGPDARMVNFPALMPPDGNRLSRTIIS